MYKINHSSITKRSRAGQGLAELCAGLLIGVPLILAGIDLGFIAIGATINDAVCRESARAAASGPPADTLVGSRKVTAGQSPYKRAMEVVKEHSTTAAIPINPEITETVRYYPIPEMGGAVDGEVAVKTTARVTPPFILRYLNGSTTVSLSSFHRTPYTYVLMPPPQKEP